MKQTNLPIFPLYTVGPATSRALSTVIATAPLTLSRLHPRVLGADSGNGAALAAYILTHYNALCQDMLFAHFHAPRLPFVPLVGDASAPRMELGDARLAKKALLFLVGEVRRDVIPRTLMGAGEAERVEVREVEVYKTGVVDGFEADFAQKVKSFEERQQQQQEHGASVMAIVVFSPSGCD